MLNLVHELVLSRPDDWHLHIRQAEVMKQVLPHSARCCGRAVIMPNTTPAIRNGEDIRRYRDEIAAAQTGQPYQLEPLMTFKIVPETTVDDVATAVAAGAFAGKVYPKNMTTNAHDGVEDYTALYPVFARMEAYRIPVLLHGESPVPGTFCLDREAEFMSILVALAKDFPELKIVLEHVTTQVAVETVLSLGPNVAATVTLHHMLLTLDDVVGYNLEPHHFCKPLAKRPTDRNAVRDFAMSGNRKALFGSDSAPHRRDKKECTSGCAGIWTAPVLIEKLAETFEDQDKLDALPGFLHAGADFHGLKRTTETIRLVRESHVVPAEINGIVPFMAGRELRWKLAA